MATLTNINGRRIVQVFVRDRRRTISVGRMSYADAQTIKGHVERLARAVDWSVPAPVETLKWLAGVSDRLHRKLAKIGLTEPRVASGGRQLKAYFESYVARRSDLKPGRGRRRIPTVRPGQQWRSITWQRRPWNSGRSY